MDRTKLYLSWLFTLGGFGVLLRIPSTMKENIAYDMPFSRIALAIIFFSSAVIFRYEWKKGFVPRQIRYILYGVVFACFLVIMYFSVL